MNNKDNSELNSNSANVCSDTVKAEICTDAVMTERCTDIDVDLHDDNIKTRRKIKDLKQGKKHFSTKNGARSLRFQVTIVFVIVMAAAIIGCMCINNLFLEDYYINEKEKTILDVHSVICNECNNGDLSSEEFDIKLQQLSGTHNVSIVIISSSMDPFKIYANEPQEMILMELQRNITGSITAERIIAETDEYILIQRKDNRLQTEYLEMWGVLPDSSFFLLRTTVESMRMSASVANRFLLYIGIGVMLVSGIAIYLVTKRISKPIVDLAVMSEKMSEMDFTAKYEGHHNNEVDMLGNSINMMSENLEKAIADLREANIELQKDNELKTQIDEMRKEFISNVSHELKTPIALIQGYAEGLKEGINEMEERDYYCDVIMDEAAKMNVMVKKLMTLNQIEAGMDVLQRENINIGALVKNYIQSANVLAEQNDIKVNLNIKEECMAYADEFKIDEVIMNYYSNAINHCEADSEKRIDVTVEKVENKVMVSVFNTGKNIPDESIDRVWEKFYKVDKARTRQYGGSGVGLSIVKAIVEAHGGECGVRNESDGVTFWFCIDAIEA